MLGFLLALLAPSSASPSARVPPDEEPAPLLPEGVSRWAGSYTCRQGPTELSLTVTRTGEHLWATFAFGPLPENPTVPAGAFRMDGTVEGQEVRLRPGEWLERPPRYVTVGLRGELDPDARELRGRVETPLPGCTTFLLRPTD